MNTKRSASLKIQNFEASLVSALPETHSLLAASNLTVHPNVSRITLHGSRGLSQGFRPDSDIDLSLITKPPALSRRSDLESFLHEVYEITQSNWQAEVEADLAIIFDIRTCGLVCFDQRTWNKCDFGGVNCFGLYKEQKGFNGLVLNAQVVVERMYPCLKIWQHL